MQSVARVKLRGKAAKQRTCQTLKNNRDSLSKKPCNLYKYTVKTKTNATEIAMHQPATVRDGMINYSHTNTCDLTAVLVTDTIL